MPRPKKPGVEPRRRSRNGCWPCKARKVKCGEEKPQCLNCERQGETCDYSIRLNWGGRTKRERPRAGSEASSQVSGSPYQGTLSFDEDVPPLLSPIPDTSSRPSLHVRSRSNVTPPRSNNFMVDPILFGMSQSPTPPIAANTASFDDFHGTSSMPTSAPFSQTQFQSTFDVQSVSAIDFGTFNYSNEEFDTISIPLPLLAHPQASLASFYGRHKHNYSMNSPAPKISDSHSPYAGPPTPFSPYMVMPLTPNSSVGSDEPVFRTPHKQQSRTDSPPDLRRMSVLNIINTDTEHSHEPEHKYPVTDSGSTTYGYDLGRPDLDTPNNDDFAAIAIFSPQADTMELDDEETLYGRADTHGKDMAFASGGYYAKPVHIRIAKSLHPLPPVLLENPMNLLYFHHFLNHTARILVPHDCQRNPFRDILPEMAVADETIMNLLLAYSAAHRARMLNHPEPSNRIAHWVQDVFPKLRQALIEPTNISDNTLAAVIMMASLEVISTGAFEVPVSWQDHLVSARQMIMARGGPRGIGRDDRVAYFLSRWFAYLDILGSLSGNKNDVPLGSFYWSNENAVADEDFEIDCLMGFTTRCVGSLARISELAKACESQRIDEDGNVREGWVPNPEIVHQAVKIRRELEEGLLERNIRITGCNHRSDSSDPQGAWDATEIYATNELFHWAGLIHLYRRVLGKPASDTEVQHAVREIVGLLYKIRRGSTAEACLIFPMFAAGCDAQEEGQREKIMDRLKGVEGFGMTHTLKIVTLMQRVWDTGKPWESLASGEFFG